MAAAFQPLPKPLPATEALLPRQNPLLGGAATRPPFRPDKDADRAFSRAAASVRARQQATLSVSAVAGGTTGPTPPGSGRGAGSQPATGRHQRQPSGGSRLVRGLSAVKDSISEGASWLWHGRDPGAGCNWLRHGLAAQAGRGPCAAF